MNKLNILINKGKLSIKKNSPTILLAAGIIGTIGSTVLACKATLDAKDFLNEKKKESDMVEEALSTKKDEGYTEEKAEKDKVIIATQTTVGLAKLYLPAVGLGVLSIGLMVKGHSILNKRNAALAAAYATVDTAFKKYRSRVVDRFGEVVDKELRYNVKAKEIKEKDKDGNEVNKTTYETTDEFNTTGNNCSDYARFFDEYNSRAHTKDPEYNLMFLRRQQDYANEKLKAQGYLFLNDVYELLEMKKTQAGQVVGWIYDPDNNENGDNYIDFGIYDIHDANKRAFVNGNEYSILLDFNVDGVIYDKI